MNAAEREAAASKYFTERYEVIAEYPFVADDPIRLWDHDPDGPANSRRCRFCGFACPDVTFKKTAHAVPEFLGNKAIRSMNECDACNGFLANEYEDHLGRWSLFARAISQVKGKAGTPTFKNPSETLRVEPGETGPNIKLSDPAHTGEIMQEGGPYQFTIPADATSQSHVPFRAAQTLVKVACSICPPGELHQCRPAIDWLMGRADFQFSEFLVLYGFTPGPLNENAGRVVLLGRRTKTAEPYLWCVIQSAGHRFQIFVPGCPADDKLFGDGPATFPAWHYPIPELGPGWPFGETKYGRLNWSGTHPVQTSATAVFHVEHAVRLTPP